MCKSTLVIFMLIVITCIVALGEDAATRHRTKKTTRGTHQVTKRSIKPKPKSNTKKSTNSFAHLANSAKAHRPAVAETNIYGLNDNYYYTTLAGIKAKNVDILIIQTEIMQEKTVNLDQIKSLYKAAKLPIYRVLTFDSIDSLTTYFQGIEAFSAKSVLFPFAYQINSILNHMVAIRIRHVGGVLDRILEDFQLPHND